MKRREFLKTGTIAAAVFGAGLPQAVQAQAANGGEAPEPLSAGLNWTGGQEPVQPYQLPTGSSHELLPKLPLSIEAITPNGAPISPMSLAERERKGVVPQRGLCSITPGEAFRDTLLSGNGSTYVELIGHPYSERLLFHHERLLIPWKRPFEAPKVAWVLPAVRKLLLAGKYREGLDLSFNAMAAAGLPMNTKAHQTIPAFAMNIDLASSISATEYLRTVNFESGEVRVMWKDARGEWLRRSFVSRADNVVSQWLQAPQGQSINAVIGLENPVVAAHDGPITFVQDCNEHRLIFTGQFDPAVSQNGYAAVTRIVRTGGSARIDGGKLMIDGAQSVMLITRIAWFETFNQSLVDSLVKAMDALAPEYEPMLERHQKLQSAIFNRVSLDFGGASQRAMAGEELLIDQRTRTGYSPALLEKIFDMGRYWLMLSCGHYPVQPMAGEVNININLQIAHGTIGNLPEAMASYYDWIESLLPDCRKNAANIFGARGAVYPILPNKGMGVSFMYASTVNAGIWPHSYWISAGGWCYNPFWDHYLVTGDLEFLRNRVVPGLKELALFYEDFLTLEDKRGNYIFVPSFSPENWPENAEPLPTPVWPLSTGYLNMTPPTPLVINSAMDVMVCREVLTHLIEASKILGIHEDEMPKWNEMLSKMPPYRTTEDGTLKEWGWPGLEENYDQRHVSHLYGAWPADEIDVAQTPQLAKAALLADRKRGPANSSAHGLCHRALAGARLKDSYLVNFELKQLLEQGYFGKTLRSSHNPYRQPMPDAQGGVPTILMEMICGSRSGIVELLPALPASLSKGSIQGMLVRSFAKIDKLSWDLDALTEEVTITSLREQKITLVVWHGIQSVTDPDKILAKAVPPGATACELHLPKGRAVSLRIKLASPKPLNWIRTTRTV